MNGPASYVNDPAQLTRQLHGVDVPIEYYHRASAIVDAALLPYARFPRGFGELYDRELAAHTTRRAVMFLRETEEHAARMERAANAVPSI
jgi:hypothetical protein